MSLASWVHLRKGRSWTATRSDEDMEVFRQGSLCLSVGKKKGTWRKNRTTVRAVIITSRKSVEYLERERDRHRGQGCSKVSYTKKESDLAEVRRDLMLLKDYMNMWLQTQRKPHQQLRNQTKSGFGFWPWSSQPGAQRHLYLNVFSWPHFKWM